MKQSIYERRTMNAHLANAVDAVKSAQHYLSLVNTQDIDKQKLYEKVKSLIDEAVQSADTAQTIGAKYPDLFDKQKFDYIKTQLGKLTLKLPLVL